MFIINHKFKVKIKYVYVNTKKTKQVGDHLDDSLRLVEGQWHQDLVQVDSGCWTNWIHF